jgi:nucleoside 2-deoxyribosyltransferase
VSHYGGSTSMSPISPRRVGPYGSAFIAMPFEDPESGDLAQLVQETCDTHDFVARLADNPVGPAMELRTDILEQVREADFVVTNMTGDNANVSYELGVARALGKRVLLLKSEATLSNAGKTNSDTIAYGDLRQREDKERFRSALVKFLRRMRNEIMPEVLDSAKSRTQRIIGDLQRLGRPKELLCRQTVWWSGYLSSFAVGDNEAFDRSERRAKAELLKEREQLIKLARRGCRIVCFISPPGPNVAAIHQSFVLPRMKGLLQFLRSAEPALDSIDWLLAPAEIKNFCIVGNICCYERFQKVGDRGDALTLRQSSAAAVRASIAMYELLFEELAYATLKGRPQHDVLERRKELRRKTTEHLEQTLEAARKLGSGTL